MSRVETPGSKTRGLGQSPPGYAQVAVLAFCSWMLVVLVLGARMAFQDLFDRLSALRSTSTAVQADVALSSGAADSMVMYAAAAFIVYTVVISAIVLCQFFRPRLTVAIAFISPFAIFVLAVLITGSLAGTLAVCALLAVSWITGDLVLRFARPPAANTQLSAKTSIRLALGLGCLGTAVLILGAFNGISLLPVALVTLVVTVVWVGLNFQSFGTSLKSVRHEPLSLPRLSWFETFLVSLSAAFFLFASLATLTPETIFTASDSVRQHLPQAREIWQGHALLVFPTLDGGAASVLGASINAVAFGLGGITAVRILQVAISLSCLVAIAGLGTTLSGRHAGIAGAAIFSAMPLVLWLTGHAYPDLLAVLLICASAQCAIFWQNDGQRIWLLLAGMLGGFSLATKQISAVVVLALLIALIISARPGATIMDRFRSALVFSLACVIAFSPWVIRAAVLTGNLPLLGTLRAQLVNVPFLASFAGLLSPLNPAAASLSTNAEAFPGGVTRSLAGVIMGPWDLTFHGAYSNWQSVRFGEFGILLLMFLPLIFFNLRSRGAVLVAIAGLLSYVGWVFTIQIPRHLLPSLALLAVLAGISVSRASSEPMTFSHLQPSRLVQVCAVLGLVLTPLFYLPNSTTRIPISVLMGSESPETYQARVDPSAAALRDASAMLPGDAPVAYIGEWLGDQSATEARLIFLGAYNPDPNDSLDRQLGSSPEAVLASLAKLGVNYIIWDRPDTRPQDIESTLLSGNFLLHYTTILGGDNGIYLFEVNPSGVPDPTAGKNLLQDPGFASLRKSGNVWNGSRRDLSENGILQPRRQSTIFQRVDVTPGQPYLLVVSGSCDGQKARVQVSLDWLDAVGSSIGATADDLALGVAPNSALIWRIAPEGASEVSVGVTASTGTPCLVKTIGMYAYESP